MRCSSRPTGSPYSRRWRESCGQAADSSSRPTRATTLIGELAVPDWRPIIRAGGLDVVSREEIPHWREDLKRMYDGWLANVDELREQPRRGVINDLIGEATAVGPTLSRRTGVLYTAERR